MRYPHIGALVLNTPLLLSPEKAQAIFNVLQNRFETDMPQIESGSFEPTSKGVSKIYQIRDGIATIPIIGSLVNRGAWIGAQSGLVSYEGLSIQIKSVMNDSSVHSIIFDINSHGGEAIGCFEVASLIRKLSSQKHTVAFVNGVACSGGYALASAANEIVITETGVAGSIGVVLLHTDSSRKVDKDGITPTFIHAGAHKVDANPLQPLTNETRSSLQEVANTYYDAFVSAVAKGRGDRLDIIAARKTEAKTYIGLAAVDVGLADSIGTLDDVIANLSRAAGRNNVQKRRNSMDNEQPAIEEGITQSAFDIAVANAKAEGAKIATDRIATILRSEEGKKRPSLAMAFAFDMTMTAEEAIKGLKAAIAEVPNSIPSIQDRLSGMMQIGASDNEAPIGVAQSNWDKLVREHNGI